MFRQQTIFFANLFQKLILRIEFIHFWYEQLVQFDFTCLQNFRFFEVCFCSSVKDHFWLKHSQLKSPQNQHLSKKFKIRFCAFGRRFLGEQTLFVANRGFWFFVFFFKTSKQTIFLQKISVFHEGPELSVVLERSTQSHEKSKNKSSKPKMLKVVSQFFSKTTYEKIL